MTDPREALVALLWEKFGAWPNGPLAAWLTKADCARFADAILTAGWAPPGERVKPSVEDVAAAIEAETASYDPVTSPERGEPESLLAADGSDMSLTAARAVLALPPGRTEAEVEVEALREAASAAVTDGEGVPWDHDHDRATVSAWLLGLADRIEAGESGE